MMGVPGTGGQLLILLLFVLPGSVYQVTRSRLRGPNPADQDATSKILRALAVSTFLNTFYVIALGDRLLGPLRANSIPELRERIDPRFGGLVALLLLFGIPAFLGALDYWRTQWAWVAKLTERFPRLRLAYDPTPRAWDYGFANQREPCFVRVLTEDDKWVGGWWGGNSFAASYPEPLELFLETAWRIDTHGSFVEEIESSSGIYIKCANAQAVEFLQPETENEDACRPEEEGAEEPQRGKRAWRRCTWLSGFLGAITGAAAGYAAARGYWG